MSEDSDRPSPTAADRLLFGVCVVVILAVAAVLISGEITGSSAPPAFETRTKPVQALQGSYQLPVVIENVGGTTATKVDVAAEIRFSGEKLTGTATIDFLAANEKATTVFVFPRDPRDGTTSVAVRSYMEP